MFALLPYTFTEFANTERMLEKKKSNPATTPHPAEIYLKKTPLTQIQFFLSTVADMNDNPPKFEQPSYSCVLSEHASRGQFVTVVSASDPDYVDHDNLIYTIAQGNELQTYTIHPVTGIITLVNMQNFAEKHLTVLNVSVTDGVYTSFTRVKINILPANLHNPVFPHQMYDVKVNENQLAGRLVITVSFRIVCFSFKLIVVGWYHNGKILCAE